MFKERGVGLYPELFPECPHARGEQEYPGGCVYLCGTRADKAGVDHITGAVRADIGRAFSSDKEVKREIKVTGTGDVTNVIEI